jgi:hypothetical protein
VEHDHALVARLDLHPMQVDTHARAGDTVHANILQATDAGVRA